MYFLTAIPKTPNLTLTPSDTSVPPGTPVTLTCVTSTSSSSSLTFDFFKDGVTVASLSLGVYEISSVGTSDAGSYTCRTTVDSFDSDVSGSVQISVLGW